MNLKSLSIVLVLLCGAAVGVTVLVKSKATPASAPNAPAVRIARVPEGGLQPQVVVRGDVVHLLYFKGEPTAGDLFYTCSTDSGATWKPAIRVNSQAKSAIASGTIRGGHMAVGRGGRVFVEWNGSDVAPRNLATPVSQRKYGAAPLLFARLNQTGDGFEPQRNLLTRSWNLDGGAGIAADEEGRVYLVWHANDEEGADEDKRRVFLSVSKDEGATFAPEVPVWKEPTGACGCCAVRVVAHDGGKVDLLYRSATQMVHRDTFFLFSTDAGRSFGGQKLATWNVNMCPMSSYALAERGTERLAAWESDKKVSLSPLDAQGRATNVQDASPQGNNPKYPELCVNAKGQTLLLWTQNTSWGRGGEAAWETFDAQMRPIEKGDGLQGGVPAWSFATAFARRDGGFTVLY